MDEKKRDWGLNMINATVIYFEKDSKQHLLKLIQGKKAQVITFIIKIAYYIQIQDDVKREYLLWLSFDCHIQGHKAWCSTELSLNMWKELRQQ